MSKKKAYIDIYEQVKNGIIKGAYPYGTKIPSKRTSADENGVSLITVEHAYELLIEEGYIEPRQRSGYIVCYSEGDGFVGGANHDGVINHKLNRTQTVTDINTNNYDYPETEFPFSVLSRAMRKVISDFSEDLMIRSPRSGCQELKEVLSQYLRRSRGFSINPNQIIIGAGSEYLYGLIVELLGSDKIYAIETPSYKKIEQVYNSRGVILDHLPLGKDGIESIFLNSSNADVLHVSPYRSYPTGVTASASKRREYISWASKENRYIIEDDFESEVTPLRKAEETLFATSKGDNVIYINTFSRTISPSIRVGYMVLSETLVKRYEEKLGFYSCTVPLFEQLVIAQLIANGDFERQINRLRRQKRSQLKATDCAKKNTN